MRESPSKTTIMQRTSRRLASVAVSAMTRRLADDVHRKAHSAPAIVRKQCLDPNQLQRLSLALNRPQLYRDVDVHRERIPSHGTPLAPGYHLVYFTPVALQDELGSDGTDVSYSPAEPFTRRMWAGGKITWEKGNPLCIGDEALETTKLVSAEPKVTRAGEEMIVIGVEKTFENAKGLALVDKRDWVFRTYLQTPAWAQDSPVSDGQEDHLPRPESSQISRDFLQTAVSLFRFSALTFNAHKIHYSQPWCRNVEGHRDIVVHGPLNLINMLDFWRDVQEDDHKIPQSVQYRATAPFYAGEKYRALLERGAGATSIRLWGNDGKGGVKMGMLGDVRD